LGLHRLTEAPLKADGTRAELQGRQAISFAGELQVRILVNAAIVMMKEFPGFAEWWFQMDEIQRDYIHQELHMLMLAEFIQISGIPERKAEQLRDCVVAFFDRIPSFTQWQTMVLGSTLRDRINYQLKDLLWKEMRKA
jgi:hypothetical protein